MAKRSPLKELTDHMNWYQAFFFNATRGLIRSMNNRFPLDPERVSQFTRALDDLQIHFNARMLEYKSQLPVATVKGRVKK